MTNNLSNITAENKIYTVLSIGQRGAGKTVFLAGCYQAFKNKHNHPNQYYISWQGEPQESAEDIEKVLSYVAKTGQYPPATLKISNFDFNLKKNSGDQPEKIAAIRWWDVPGESCQIYNLAFINMAMHADACLLFLDASSLLDEEPKNNQYLNIFKALVEIIQHNKQQFNLGIIITKCDLVISHKKLWQSLHSKVQELEKNLQETQVNYQFFYSTVLIDSQAGTLQANQAIDSMSWLFSQIDHKLVNFAETTSHHSTQALEPQSIKTLVTVLISLMVMSTLGLVGIIAWEKISHNSSSPVPAFAK
jgi:Double-GTPase 2